ncbi:MAG: 6-phosphogluconolactonase [Gallionellaceae bacterium]|jgi:6-phosphogluconolactonase
MQNLPLQICRWQPFTTASQLEQAAVEKILSLAKQAIAARGAFHIVLAGGTTPRRVYEALRQANTNWQAWHIYFGDERCLPAQHAERNSLMASLAWLDHVGIPEQQIHPIPAELGAAKATENYSLIINELHEFDLVLLGLGEDGHTASLFPGHELGTMENAPDTLAVFDAPKPPPERVSLSAHRLSNARQVIFLVTGKSKLQAVNDWRAGSAIPAAAITPKAGVDIYIENDLIQS